MHRRDYNCVVVLGPTASGKTQLACRLAVDHNGEIISADSRQVYKNLDIGTGKDLHEYKVGDKTIPYHIINVAEPEEHFYLHDFQRELKRCFEEITKCNKLPIICGGTGMYLDALRKDFSFTQVPEDAALREKLALLPKSELLTLLQQYREEFISHVDTSSVKRLIRGIEVARWRSSNALEASPEIVYSPLYLGIIVSVESRRALIRKRLEERLNHGLIQEVEQLLSKGITHQRLQMLGLEYKYVSLLLQGAITMNELMEQLCTAIIRFSKRQMTWFRKMEKEGVRINWLQYPVNYEEAQLIVKREGL